MAEQLSKNQENILDLLARLNAECREESALSVVADFLGYNLSLNPLEPHGPWRMLGHEDFGRGHIFAVRYVPELSSESRISDLRRIYHQYVEEFKINFYLQEQVSLIGLIGEKRMVWYRAAGGNRDERLDLSEESVRQVSLFADLFVDRLSFGKAEIEKDEFGFASPRLKGLEELFKWRLGERFQHTVEMYRRRLAEVIAVTDKYRALLQPILMSDARSFLRKGQLSSLIETPSFKAGLGAVVDTIVLRVILRHFLESYHGPEAFRLAQGFENLGLGHAGGRMNEVLEELVHVVYPDLQEITDEKMRRGVNQQLEFELFFEQVAPDVESIIAREEQIYAFQKQLREQFEQTYGGDLFEGDVAEVANVIEQAFMEDGRRELLQMIADTGPGRFNFRYEDLPPEMIQNHYEDSMSRSVQIDYISGSLKASYGVDRAEQKQKGAYYTDNIFVSYMASNSINRIFKPLLDTLNKAIVEGEIDCAQEALDKIVSLRIVDITCGGGSFLRGAFHHLSSLREKISEAIGGNKTLLERYPYFGNNSDSQSEWERHVLLNNLYGIDIDYRALIISSQTLTLSALRNWQPGQNFPQLIGLTLAHQNALISMVPPLKRVEIFSRYKKEICHLMDLRNRLRLGEADDSVWREIRDIRLHMRNDLMVFLPENMVKFAEIQHIDVLELQFPEVFFDEEGNWIEGGGFDIVLGNPPWERWKLNKEEFFGLYNPEYAKNSTSPAVKKAIITDLYAKYPNLENRLSTLSEMYDICARFFKSDDFFFFQRWKVDGNFTGGEPDLYRIAGERIEQLVRTGGEVSIIMPSGLNTDKGATGLRHMLFEEVSLHELLAFENRGQKLFANVDPRYKFSIVSFSKKKPNDEHKFDAFFYRSNKEDLLNREVKMQYPLDLVMQAAPDTWSLLEFRDVKELQIMEKLHLAPSLSNEIEGAWRLRLTYDLHMSKDSSLFNERNEGWPVFQGGMIEQFTCTFADPRYHVQVEKGRERLLKKEQYRLRRAVKGEFPYELKIHPEAYRLAIRDVASATNSRTLIAAILPKNVFSGNKAPTSIPFDFGEDGYESLYSERELLVMTALLNSYTVDFVLRRKVDETVNYFYVYQLPVPRLVEGDMYFEELLERAAKLTCVSPEFEELRLAAGIECGVTDPTERRRLQNEIDAFVSMAFGLSEDELRYIVEDFTRNPRHVERVRNDLQGILDCYRSLQPKYHGGK